MPRIAYFILAHAQAEQLARLLTQLNGPNTHFYIHIDANTPTDVFAAMQIAIHATQCKATLIARQPCRWGGFSLVDASLKLIQSAMLDGFDWGVLLSGQDYPLHSNEYINNFLKNTNHVGFIDLKSPAEFDVAYRYRAWHFETLNGQQSGKALQKVQRIANRLGLKRRLPEPIQHIYAGSQWWMLNQQACQAILDFIETHPKVMLFFQYTLVPDEMFFQSILMHTDLAPKLSHNAMRYLEWEPGAWSPKTFQPQAIAQLAHRVELFARKFSADLDSHHALRLLHELQKRQNEL